ncbi:Uncharacterized protein T4B_6881 [Trichinella pseudospiralis]|uniref:DH domain-containing protein n=2 Tax=Trichinella pseudospiralis TaxID=6337 RepID=A0A0V1JX21_TRIPS|nr:Uncharacterized protein T4A_5289 [Trichinella pseudospiralis]KRZ33195.1 Uncharacterized protein T4B_6881 [Trichinella pseudospiralis]KRZ39521.1 Uncharacterized protein T4C_12900 [Trichinella pseudospiralis]
MPVTTSADECDSMALRDWSGRGERHLRKRYSRSFTMSPPAGTKPSTTAVVLDGSPVWGVALAGKRGSLTSVNKKPDLPVWARVPALRKTNSVPSSICNGEAGAVLSISSISSASRKSSSHSASSCFSNCLTPPGLEQPSSDEPDWSTPRGSFAITNDHSLDHDHNREPDDDHHRDRDEDQDADDEDTTELLSPSTTNADISELQAAAQTIEALSRRSWRRVSDFTSALPLTEMNLSPKSTVALDRHRLSRRSGITTHLGGQPRGVIQFLPSVRKSEILSRNAHQAYMVDKVRRQRLCSDGNLIQIPQMADQLCLRVPPTAVGDSDVGDAQMRLSVLSSKNNSPNSCRSSTPRSGYNGRGSSRYAGAETSPRKSLSTTGAGRPPPDMLLTNADDDRFSTLDTLDSVNRFTSLLRSLRSPSAGIADADRYPSSTADGTLSSSSELSDVTDYSYSSPPSEGILSDSDSSFLQADLLLWRRRSKGSIRKHQAKTETSYVENLKLLVHKYLRPLKRPELCSLVELGTLNEIFFQVPEMLGHHELFLAALKSRLDFWDCKQKIGDVVLNNFTKQSVIDTYTAFINNWKNARVAIRKACIAKPAFAKYLERCSREHQNKLNLDALLIMPVQRIPRYELLIKELVKHTSVEHPDHALLLRAGKEIHELASKIDQIQQETGFSDQMQQKLREIEAIVEGLDDLVSPERTFYRCDLVFVETPSGKKDRCLFLFSDLLLITTVTSKTGSNLTKSSQQTSPGLSRNFFEKHKFRLLLKLSLQDLSIVDNKKLLIMKVREDIANLQEDLRVVGKLAELTLLLKIDHKGISKEIENLSDFIKVTLGTKHEELAKDPNLASLNLMVTTEFGNEPLLMTFRNTEKRLTWERNFEDAKYAFALSQSQRQPPAFVKFIAANRTRAGLHFTCASPAWPRNSVGTSDVWMCSSDQCSGQLCVLSASTDFEVININSLCNSRISCICCIPGNSSRRNAVVVGAKSRKLPSSGILTNNNHLTMPTNIDLDSDSTDNESSTEESRISEVDRVDDKLSRNYMLSAVSQKIPHLDAENCEFLFTTWIGTENGIIQIYDRNESMRTGKCKSEMQLQSSIRCMLYHENKIFVALGDGNVGLYDCEDENQKSMKFLELEQKFAPISAMVIAVNKLWCGSRNHILVINLNTFKIECLFAVNNDRESTIECLASSALAVWLSMYNSAVVKLYHAHKRECLIEINVAPTVTKTLAGCDDIIRQHKLACLRVTSLLCCKEMLWVGTSAGVLCYLPIPQVTHQTLKITTIPGISGTNIGHMGPCRFLVSLEVPEYIMDEFVAGKRAKRNDLSRRRMSLNVASLQQKNVYVISGGEGLEDFQDSPNDENDDTFGLEDSTNYLIIWKA